jgi:small GTP-binding protein
MDTFSATLLGTVGVDFKAKKVCLEGENLQIQVWDTAGQEQFHKITTSYYKGANGIMLVYDVTDEKSANEVNYWMKNIKSHAADNVSVVMVANKADLLMSNDSPILITGRNNAKKNEIQHFFTSAKDSSGVDDAFMSLVKLIVSSDAIVKSKSHLLPAAAPTGPKLAPGVDPNKGSSTLATIFRGKSKGDSSASSLESATSNGEKQGKDKCVLS